MNSRARKFAEDNWRQLVLKHTNGGACNFQAAAAELAALVEAAERERWREIVEQLIACHEELTCPAVALAREWLEGPNVGAKAPT